MPNSAEPSYDERVLLVAPTRRDGEVTCEALAVAGIACTACNGLQQLGQELAAGVGALMLTDRALVARDFTGFMQALEAQPSWSDVPIVLMCHDRDRSPAAIQAIERMRNVTLLDRPASMRSMISAVQAALRGRRWQYQIRDQIVVQRRAEEALRLADQRKDEFLATLAHELRNPLAPIKTGLQLLHRTPSVPPTVAPVLSMMDRQLGQLVKLVDELLDVSRIATGKVVLSTERVDLRAVVEHAVEASQPIIDAAGHALRVHLPDHPVQVLGDASRLSQALGNILNNAAKYTPRGGRITVSLTGGQDAVLSVSDTGVGIPATMIDRVFDMFTQVDRTLDRAQGGLGIGLSLVRSLIDLHGGSVTARSTGVDQGSQFEIRLPAAAASPTSNVAERAAADGSTSGSSPLRVMVVDDNVDAADALGMLLQLSGHAVRVEYSARSAIKAIPSFLPEAVFCDLGMPGMGGHAFAEVLRQDSRFASTTLVAVTGWGTDEDRQHSRAAGFNHHLTKPASAESIEAILMRR